MTMTHEISGRLPPRARARALALQSAADVAHASVSELSSKLRELRWNRQEISNHVRTVTDRRFSGGRDILTGNEVAAERQRLADLDAEIGRVAVIVDAQSEAHASARALIGRIEEFIRAAHQDCSITDRPVAPPAIKRGEDVRGAIDSRRRRVRELITERANVETAPIPSTEAKRRAREQVERLAERGRVNVGPLLSSGDPFRFAHMVSLVKVPPSAGSVETIDVAATIAWLLRDQLIAAIEREIDQQADDSIALDDRQRAARLEQIANELIATEREEVALLDLAAEQGLAIQHRGDIDVRALLEIEIAVAAAAA